MSLTIITPPAEERTFDFKLKPSYDRSPHSTYASGSSKIPKSHAPELPSFHAKSTGAMSTQHRGLPPPAAMTLHDPLRGPPPPPPPLQSSVPGSLERMPPPPPQPQAASDDAWKNWLSAKSEEDRRRQEEEKTRQEELRLEQRKVEQNILRDACGYGIPPHLVPMIFAGLAGGNVAGLSMEMAQQYIAQYHQTLQQQPQQYAPIQSVSDSRRESTITSTPRTNPHSGSLQGPPSAAQPIISQGQNPGISYSSPASYQSPASRARALAPGFNPTEIPGLISRHSTLSSLPRLTTNEAQVHPGHAAAAGHHSHSSSMQQDRASPSPSIYFHHWQPPQTQSTSPKDSSQKTSPDNSGKLPSHVMGSDSRDSPRKRKATGSHQPAPLPSSKNTSPSFLNRSSSTRRRKGSDSSTRSYDPIGRASRASGHIAQQKSEDSRTSREDTKQSLGEEESPPEPQQRPSIEHSQSEASSKIIT